MLPLFSDRLALEVRSWFEGLSRSVASVGYQIVGKTRSGAATCESATSLPIRFTYESPNCPITCRVESIQISDSSFDGIQIHFIVRMTQVVSEATDRAPGNIRLVQFGERAELDSRF